MFPDWKYTKLFLADYRTWLLPVLTLILLIMDWASGVGDYTKLLSRTGNIAVLIVMALTTLLFIRSVTDVTFFPDKEWEDLWNEGPMQAIAVALIYVGQFVLAGLLGMAMINPLL